MLCQSILSLANDDGGWIARKERWFRSQIFELKYVPDFEVNKGTASVGLRACNGVGGSTK